MYEGSARVPFIVAGPGMDKLLVVSPWRLCAWCSPSRRTPFSGVPEDNVSTDFVSLLDLYPTFLDIAGADVPRYLQVHPPPPPPPPPSPSLSCSTAGGETRGHIDVKARSTPTLSHPRATHWRPYLTGHWRTNDAPTCSCSHGRRLSCPSIWARRLTRATLCTRRQPCAARRLVFFSFPPPPPPPRSLTFAP